MFEIIYWTHIITGTIAFFVGPFQFVKYIRERYTGLHRLFGKTYVANVFISAPTGFIISFKTPLWGACLGTAAQSVLWFAVTYYAYLKIRRREIITHQRFMIRSYALVLAAPMLRICIVVLGTFTQVDYLQEFDFYYPLFVWISFLPLLIAEVVLRLLKKGSNANVSV